MKAEQEYISIFSQNKNLIDEHSSEVINGLRDIAFQDFKRLGFPASNDEDYSYTDMQKLFMPDYGLNLKRYNFKAEQKDLFHCSLPNLSTYAYFVVNDSFYGRTSATSSLPENVYAGSLKSFTEKYPEIAAKYYGKSASTSTDGMVALNTMFAQDGFVLYVPQGVSIDKPIQLINVFRSEFDFMANRRILIIVEAQASAKLLVCDHSMGTSNFLSNEVIEIFAEENAFFDIYDLEESNLSTSRFSSVHVEQAAGSNVLVNGITLNNGITRNNYRINLNGPYAESTLCGMSILDKNQQADVFSNIAHNAPDCQSNELFKNVLDGHSRGAFRGRIFVKEGAQKTNAYQTNRNLCLTKESRMYSKPQLEIYADDVKCSHGMTTGELDENAIFYMRSRGISEEEARLILSIAFTSDVIDYVRLDALKSRLHQLVDGRFRNGMSGCADCAFCN